jgi:hypothetical protein
LLEAVADIRTICEAQFGSPEPGATAPVDQPAVPEILQSPDQRNDQQLHEALKAARNLLYVDLWELFSAEMQCRLEDIAGGRGEVLANFRGLVMSTDGLDTTVPPVYQPKGQATASVGTATFANFSRDQRRGEGFLAVRAPYHAAFRLSRVRCLRGPGLARDLRDGIGVEQPVHGTPRAKSLGDRGGGVLDQGSAGSAARKREAIRCPL